MYFQIDQLDHYYFMLHSLIFSGGYSKETWYLSSEVGYWEQRGEMNESRAYHKCASFSINQERFVAVSPGATGSNVEFLKLESNSSAWIQGTYNTFFQYLVN